MFLEIVDAIVRFWDEYGDPRSKQFLFTSSPFPIIITILIHSFIVQIILPAIFKGRKHPKFRSVLVVWYAAQHILMTWFFCRMVYYFIILKFNFRCEPIIYYFEGDQYNFVVETYWWLCFKNFEMVESFLLYIHYGSVPKFITIHHIVLPLMITLSMHFYISGSPIIFGVFHNFDHAICFFFIAIRMYSEEFKQRSEIWFKKFQFIVSITSVAVTVIFYLQLEKRDDCDFEGFKYVAVMIGTFFLIFLLHGRWQYIVPKYKFKVIEESYQ